MPHQPPPGEQPPAEHAEELLAMVAHELRQPLTALLGALMTLPHHTQALSRPQQQELLGMAHRQGEQLQRLLDQLLAAASVDHLHAPSARRSLVDVAALAEEAGHAARLAHPNHPITIEPVLVTEISSREARRSINVVCAPDKLRNITFTIVDDVRLFARCERESTFD